MSDEYESRRSPRGRGMITDDGDEYGAHSSRTYEYDEPPAKRFHGEEMEEEDIKPRVENIIFPPLDIVKKEKTTETAERTKKKKPNQFYELIKTRNDGQSKQGSSGHKVRITANFFRLIKQRNWCLYHYHVTYLPDVELPSSRKGLLRPHHKLIGGNIFDGTSLYLTRRLESDSLDLFSKRQDAQVRITINFVGEISMDDSRSLLILNTIMRKALEGLKLQQIGRNFFDAVSKISLREFNLEMWPGYLTAIRQHEHDVLLCTEISHKVMRTDTVYDIMSTLERSSRGTDYKDIFLRTVVGMVVLTDYNNKFYRIDDVDWITKPTSIFQKKGGSTSYVDYYKTKYNIRIRDMDQPMLISNSKPRDIRMGQAEVVALVPELCRATGITDEMRTNFQLMRAMCEFTRIGPDVRVRKLMDFNVRMTRSPESMAVFREWQMQLDKSLVEIEGRELNNEKIVFGDNLKSLSDRNADWTKEFRGNCTLFNVEALKRWYIIYLDRNAREAREFVDLLRNAASNMGFTIEKPRPMALPDDRAHTYTTCVEKCLQTDPQLIMLISPNNRADRYSAIKKKCCVERGVPTQVLLSKTITAKRGANPRSLMSIASKVSIQLNCKLGYSPWSIEMPLTGVMTIGFDVCHDSSNKSRSFGALVASMDIKLYNKYYSSVSVHNSGDELSGALAVSTGKALREYRRLHGTLPAKIIFYRDGVAEGQLQYVVDYELTEIRQTLRSIYRAEGMERKLSFGFIVVNKRVNSRFFKNNAVNPTPGTVIDDVVTQPESYDFYLISQCVRQGTVSPTYYNVLSENLGLNADKIQIYTYKMCHLYYNWSGTTRVPAVCQYAHKLAALVGQHLHSVPHNQLEKKLYFL